MSSNPMLDPSVLTPYLDPDAVETQVFDWGILKWIAVPETTGSTLYSLGVVIVFPGAGHERHSHPESDEAIIVLAGRGRQVVEDHHGREKVSEIRTGDVVHIPAGAFHSTINVGWEPLRSLVLYCPAGPELILRELPGVRLIPPTRHATLQVSGSSSSDSQG